MQLAKVIKKGPDIRGDVEIILEYTRNAEITH